ncbi:hypothetical protein SCP_0406340 [Sparassis crispa]|uniref:RING-type domain-containing protein n=1 Tax=Sparassis crispa TaxID=139825 RepID=A0A401GJC0_9APHY|nr:hypothetical protein SCP_0406340 [Sparassis crispa]GBE82250.1 hypothetical protein SCP_0406340 [Sparassis crispa]
MSQVSSRARPDLDFWEFVHCCKCHQSFISNSGGSPSVPFWLTECGHVICNIHLNADQSCAQCGEQGIQLIPLQREMDAPMSDWFRSVPQAFDTVAYGAKFQMETMASLVRYYRDKYTAQRALIDRLKGEHLENKVFKKTVQDLHAEIAQLRQYLGYAQEAPHEINMNGKRPRVENHRVPSGSRTNSSPRSIITPVGPNRLTLGPDRQQPSFSQQSHPSHEDDEFARPRAFQSSSRNANAYSQETDRPGSSRFIRQYAYVPPHTPQSQGILPPVLSHAQAAPARRAAARQSQGQSREPGSGQTHTPMMAAPEAGRDPRLQRSMASALLAEMEQSTHRTRSQLQMPPPPTPQLRRETVPQRTHQLPASSAGPSQRFMSATPSRSSGNFLPPRTSQSQSQSQRFFSSGSISMAQSTSTSGGQRMPFLPGP